jgi:hypothetical protein
MIHGVSGKVRVFIALGATDMRKSINGLSLLVEEQFELDLFSGSYLCPFGKPVYLNGAG